MPPDCPKKKCPNNKNQWYPVAYWPWKYIPVEYNYDTHNQKRLAIILTIKHWQHYLEGSQHPVKILMDHKNLEVFILTKILNR